MSDDRPKVSRVQLREVTVAALTVAACPRAAVVVERATPEGLRVAATDALLTLGSRYAVADRGGKMEADVLTAMRLTGELARLGDVEVDEPDPMIPRVWHNWCTGDRCPSAHEFQGSIIGRTFTQWCVFVAEHPGHDHWNGLYGDAHKTWND